MFKWIVLILEIIIYFYFYFFGVNGIKKLNLLKSQEKILNQEINTLLKTNLEQEKELELFKSKQVKDFYKERIAREQLQLSMPQDEIYIIKK